MHRVILNPPANKQVDHREKELEGLDNQRKNLRIGTSSDNQHNRGKNRNNTSGYKNIFKDKQSGKWQVAIMANWKVHYGGLFESIDEAVSARDRLISQLHGSFSRTEANNG
jgi:hypothetical protein